ncbi:oligosaccharide flippase family protein [Sphingomonas sp. RHCKR7]|uniref:oligosaccharide flippase family protein n=1 Tax=Sphingomonas folli TaxID=2862497 RepID=UPI001CA54572|nr:oligosaccharide flippase family protein [Sphingomonas folli]MBW6526744.1 oligosaccharide flippase family protein [Sphingomonas folli]
MDEPTTSTVTPATANAGRPGGRTEVIAGTPSAGLDPSGEQVVALTAAPRGRLIALVGRFRDQLVNLTAFTLLQAASYLIPVVTIPYFARILGIAGLGLLAVSGAVALAAGVAMDYAVQLSGTRFAASHADDPAAINRYLDVTTFLKLTLLCPIMLGLVGATLVSDQVAAHFWVFFWSLVSAATICLFPQWLFQGLLAMPVAARILVSCRVGSAVGGMLLVRGEADTYAVPMTQAIGGMVALLAAVIALRRRYSIVPGRASVAEARALLRDNWTLFSATAWGAAYSHGGIIIMSALLSTTSIGFYSIAQKISQAFVSMFNVAAQTAFPSFVRSHRRNAGEFPRQILLYMTVVIAGSAAALAIMFLARHPIYGFFAGERNQLGVTIFVLWMIASLFTITSVSLNPVMVVLRLDGAMASFYRLTGVTFLVLAPLACHYFGVVGMASAMLLTEGLMATFFAISVLRAARATRTALPH